MPKFRSCRLNGVAAIAITYNKKPGHFWPKKFPVNFVLHLLIYVQKKISILTLWFLRNWSSNLQINLKEI